MTKNDKKNIDSIDEFAESIQKEITEKEKEIFSKKVIDEVKSPNNMGRIKDPDGSSKFTGPCGDSLEFYLKVKNRTIEKVTFMTDGCGPTVACASIVTKIIEGKKIEKAENITDKDIIDALDGLPEENEHCAKLAVLTLGKAIKNYKQNYD